MSKYTKELEARVKAFAAENGNTMNLALANELAEETAFVKAGITGRSIVAKVRTMGITYEAKERTAKDGSKVVRKDEIVEKIEGITGLKLDGLEKAGKQTLQALFAWVEEAASVDA